MVRDELNVLNHNRLNVSRRTRPRETPAGAYFHRAKTSGGSNLEADRSWTKSGPGAGPGLWEAAPEPGVDLMAQALAAEASRTSRFDDHGQLLDVEPPMIVATEAALPMLWRTTQLVPAGAQGRKMPPVRPPVDKELLAAAAGDAVEFRYEQLEAHFENHWKELEASSKERTHEAKENKARAVEMRQRRGEASEAWRRADEAALEGIRAATVEGKAEREAVAAEEVREIEEKRQRYLRERERRKALRASRWEPSSSAPSPKSSKPAASLYSPLQMSSARLTTKLRTPSPPKTYAHPSIDRVNAHDHVLRPKATMSAVVALARATLAAESRVVPGLPGVVYGAGGLAGGRSHASFGGSHASFSSGVGGSQTSRESVRAAASASGRSFIGKAGSQTSRESIHKGVSHNDARAANTGPTSTIMRTHTMTDGGHEGPRTLMRQQSSVGNASVAYRVTVTDPTAMSSLPGSSAGDMRRGSDWRHAKLPPPVKCTPMPLEQAGNSSSNSDGAGDGKSYVDGVQEDVSMTAGPWEGESSPTLGTKTELSDAGVASQAAAAAAGRLGASPSQVAIAAAAVVSSGSITLAVIPVSEDAFSPQPSFTEATGGVGVGVGCSVLQFGASPSHSVRIKVVAHASTPNKPGGERTAGVAGGLAMTPRRRPAAVASGMAMGSTSGRAGHAGGNAAIGGAMIPDASSWLGDEMGVGAWAGTPGNPRRRPHR